MSGGMFDNDDDDDNDDGERGKARVPPPKRQRALPDEFALFPRQVRIELLSKLKAADLEPFCKTSAMYQLIYCGVESRDAPVDSVPDRDIVFEHWLAWLERDYGVHGDADRCRAYAGAERRWVAESMRRYVPVGTSNLEKLRKYRLLYDKLQITGDNNFYNRFFTAPNHYFWYQRDGIVVVSENGNDREYLPLFEGGGDGRYIGLMSIVDVVRVSEKKMWDAPDTRFNPPVFILTRQTPGTLLLGVFGSDVHTGVYLVVEEERRDFYNSVSNIADYGTAVVVTDDAVLLAQLTEKPFGLGDLYGCQLFADPVGAPYSGFFAFQQQDGTKRVFEVSGDDAAAGNRDLTPDERTLAADYKLFVPVLRATPRELSQQRELESAEEFGITTKDRAAALRGYVEQYNLALPRTRIRIGGPVRVTKRSTRFVVDDEVVYNYATVTDVFYKYHVEVRGENTDEWQTRCFTITDQTEPNEPGMSVVRVFFVPVVRRMTANQAARFDCRIVVVWRPPPKKFLTQSDIFYLPQYDKEQAREQFERLRDQRAPVRIDTLYIERATSDTPRVVLQYNNVQLPPEFGHTGRDARILGVIEERTVLFFVPSAYFSMSQPDDIDERAAQEGRRYGTRVLAAFDVLNGEYRELSIGPLDQYYLVRIPERPFMRIIVLDNDLTSLRAEPFLRAMREYKQRYGARYAAIVNSPRPCNENIAEQYPKEQFYIAYK